MDLTVDDPIVVSNVEPPEVNEETTGVVTEVTGPEVAPPTLAMP